MPSKCPLLWGVKSILWRGALQKNDTRSGKSDRSCRLFCAFSICDDTGRRQWRNYVGMHVATTIYHHDPAEGISNCFKIKPSLFLLHTFGHHLEHERLSNFSNFCKTKTLAYFWKTRPPDYFWIEISLFSLPFPFMQEKQMQSLIEENQQEFYQFFCVFPAKFQSGYCGWWMGAIKSGHAQNTLMLFDDVWQ